MVPLVVLSERPHDTLTGSRPIEGEATRTDRGAAEARVPTGDAHRRALDRGRLRQKGGPARAEDEHAWWTGGATVAGGRGPAGTS